MLHMTETLSLDGLIAALEKLVETGLAQLHELEASGRITMGAYGPRETLCQIVWWCATSADGMESVAAGGEPVRIYAPDDEMDARAVGRFTGRPVVQLAEQMVQAQARLRTAARSLTDHNALVFQHSNGRTASAQQCLEELSRRWQECLAELQA
jgi:hypothetical protein